MKLLALIFILALPTPAVASETTAQKPNENAVELEVFKHNDTYYAKAINRSGAPIYYEFVAEDALQYTVQFFDGGAWKEAVWDPGLVCGNSDLSEIQRPAEIPTWSLPDHKYKQVELFDLDSWKTGECQARVAIVFSWNSKFKRTFKVYSKPYINRQQKAAIIAFRHMMETLPPNDAATKQALRGTTLDEIEFKEESMQEAAQKLQKLIRKTNLSLATLTVRTVRSASDLNTINEKLSQMESLDALETVAETFECDVRIGKNEVVFFPIGHQEACLHLLPLHQQSKLGHPYPRRNSGGWWAIIAGAVLNGVKIRPIRDEERAEGGGRQTSDFF